MPHTPTNNGSVKKTWANPELTLISGTEDINATKTKTHAKEGSVHSTSPGGVWIKNAQTPGNATTFAANQNSFMS